MNMTDSKKLANCCLSHVLLKINKSLSAEHFIGEFL
jgi:hypothetical protein